MSTTTCPVLYPSYDDFQDFHKYISKLEKLESIHNFGICKVIPPSGWFNRSYDQKELNLQVKSPVKQVISGKAGVYDVNLLELADMDLDGFIEYDRINNCNDNNEAVERKFWKSLSGASPWDDPIYGADMIGTLFPANEKCSWNVNKLDSLLRLLDATIPGVNCAMLYIGTWRSMFAFHVEDMNLYSINYVHTGRPKSWYSVSANYKNRFESMAGSYFGDEENLCKEYLRHKTKLFSPQKLKEHGIQYSTAVQYPGEFIITFPGAYHAGFNHGYNIAESTNFASWMWLNTFAKKAKYCLCRPHTVRINIDMLETLFARQLIRDGFSRYSIDGNIHTDIDFISMRRRCFCKTYCRVATIIDPDSDNFSCRLCGASCHKICLLLAYPHLSEDCCDLCDVLKMPREASVQHTVASMDKSPVNALPSNSSCKRKIQFTRTSDSHTPGKKEVRSYIYNAYYPTLQNSCMYINRFYVHFDYRKKPN